MEGHSGASLGYTAQKQKLETASTWWKAETDFLYKYAPILSPSLLLTHTHTLRKESSSIYFIHTHQRDKYKDAPVDQ